MKLRLVEFYYVFVSSVSFCESIQIEIIRVFQLWKIVLTLEAREFSVKYTKYARSFDLNNNKTIKYFRKKIVELTDLIVDIPAYKTYKRMITLRFIF